MNGVQTRLGIKERPYGKKYKGKIIQKHKNNLFVYYTYKGNVYLVDIPYDYREEIRVAEDVIVVAKDNEYLYHSSTVGG